MRLEIFDELPDGELDRMERLAAAATAGPWFSYIAGRDPDALSSCIEVGVCNELGTFRTIELTGASTADQDFMASARQDLPRLLQEVRVLRARLRSSHAQSLSSVLRDVERPQLSVSM
ncbi:MAG: hypothetical protein ABW106_05470 [Steroidobacteraceae bacterium]